MHPAMKELIDGLEHRCREDHQVTGPLGDAAPLSNAQIRIHDGQVTILYGLDTWAGFDDVLPRPRRATSG